MQNSKIQEAKKLAKQFLQVVDVMEKEEERLNEPNENTFYQSPKHRGAVRRKSMDLTRALAEMRKP
jgi:hypothetical protein